jgi:hypothetical protein
MIGLQFLRINFEGLVKNRESTNFVIFCRQRFIRCLVFHNDRQVDMKSRSGSPRDHLAEIKNRDETRQARSADQGDYRPGRLDHQQLYLLN